MSAPLRFLALAVFAWAGVRAASLGLVPGVGGATPVAAAEPALPPIVPTEFPPIEPVQPAGPSYYGYAINQQFSGPPQAPRIFYYPAYAAAGPPQAPVSRARYTHVEPVSGPIFHAPIRPLEDWPLTRIAGGTRHSGPAPAAPSFTQPERLDRIQMTAWALLRGQALGQPQSQSLASGGTLGGSQAGARLTYAFDRRIAASLRTSAPVGAATRGGEVAAGVRLTPLQSLPLALIAERRQSFGEGGGRSAFAMFVEGGLYQRPMPLDLSLDAYVQAGVVGARSRDLFADGAVSLMRPLYGPVSVGVGSWAGVQPGLYRVDAGPRLSMRVRRNMRIDLDWRQRLAGQAEPGSGPALTLSGNF